MWFFFVVQEEVQDCKYLLEPGAATYIRLVQSKMREDVEEFAELQVCAVSEYSSDEDAPLIGACSVLAVDNQAKALFSALQSRLKAVPIPP